MQELKSVGQKTAFDTGSMRDSQQGRGMPELLSPIALLRDAIHMQKGALKYGPRNWEKGQPLSQYIRSAMRHLTKMMAGMQDQGYMVHADAVAWNINAYRHTKTLIDCGELPSSLDDMPKQSQGMAYAIETLLGETQHYAADAQPNLVFD